MRRSLPRETWRSQVIDRVTGRAVLHQEQGVSGSLGALCLKGSSQGCAVADSS